MGELVPFPKRQPIYVFVPPVSCEVPNCKKARQCDMVAFFQKEGRLELFQICAHHTFLWKGVAPALFFPLNTAPSLALIARKIEEEIARRQPPSVVYQFTNFGNVANTTTGTHFRFN